MSEAGNWVRVASLSEIAAGSCKALKVQGLDLAVYHLEDGGIYCTDNICTHAFALLTDGWLEGCMVECPLHAGQFDVRTGKGQGAPIEEDLKTFPVKLDGDAVLVQLPG